MRPLTKGFGGRIGSAGGEADIQWEVALAACLLPGLMRRLSWQRLLTFITAAVGPGLARRRPAGKVRSGAGLSCREGLVTNLRAKRI